MKTMARVCAAVLAAAVCVHFVARTPEIESPPPATADSPARGEAPAAPSGSAVVSALEPSAQDGLRSPVPESQFGAPTSAGTNALRVILEGISEGDAPKATVTLIAGEHLETRPIHGLTSEYDLDPFMASAAQLTPYIDALEVEVDHPQHLRERARVPLPEGIEGSSGRVVHEVRFQLDRPEYWPEFTLAVRDAYTREHLEGIELRFAPGVGSAAWGRNQTNTLLRSGLSSPIALMGGREAGEAEVAGLALSPAAGEPAQLIELPRRFGPERGVIVSARAPGYAWGSASLDVTEGPRELLLEPAASLTVRLTGLQPERYTALDAMAVLCVYWVRPDDGNQYVRFEPLSKQLATDPPAPEALRLESLVPGGYRVTVELGGGSWAERPALARSELNLAAGEARELVLALTEPPELPQRAPLGGRISLPSAPGPVDEEHVRLQLYFQPTQRWNAPDVEFPLADLQRVGGAFPTWSFRAEDLPVGMYRVQLLPFLKVMMVELPPEGREDVELVLEELAEVLVETVDHETGARIPLDAFYYKRKHALPGQRQNDWARALTEEPGRFRLQTTPGRVAMWPRGQDRLGYGLASETHDLVPGPQSLRFELAPIYAMRFEFREAGVTLPIGDPGMLVMKNIRPVDHDGRVTDDGLQADGTVQVSAPGLYEISFKGLDAELYHPLPPRRVAVREDGVVDVIVDLRQR